MNKTNKTPKEEKLIDGEIKYIIDQYMFYKWVNTSKASKGEISVR